MRDRVFQDTTGTDSTKQAVQNHAGDDPRMYRRLPPFTVVLRFPLRPTATCENLIEQPDRMTFTDHRIQCRGK